jgi:hypothetical protein
METHLSVLPILKLVSRLHGLKFIYLTCDTREELKHNLTKMKKKPGYGILYLSFHGHPGQIVVDEARISMESLASYMGNGFANWVVHFGSCETIDVEPQRISRFMHTTGVSMVLGYNKNVIWAETAALDLLILDWLQRYREMRRMWSRFSKNYKDLISITGLKAFHK